MSMPGHHALLFEVAGGVVLVGALFALTFRKKKTTVEALTAEDMQRIDNRLVEGDLARTESRFRRRYGVEAKPKDFVKPPEPKPMEPQDEEPKL